MHTKRVVKRAREEAENSGAQKDREHRHIGPCSRLVVDEVDRWECEEKRHEQHGTAEVTMNVH